MEIRRLGPGEGQALIGVGACFDGPVREDAAPRFLLAESLAPD